MAPIALDPDVAAGKASKPPMWRRGIEALTSFAALDQRMLLFAFAMVAGVLFYFSLALEPDLNVTLGALAIAAFAFFLIRGRSTSLLAAAIALSIFAASFGFAAAAVRARLVASAQVKSERPPAMIEGWVTGIEQARKGVRVRIDVHAISGLEAHETPKTVRLTHTSRLEVSSGRFVRCWAVLRPPPEAELQGDFDFRRQAWFQELGAVGYVQGRCRGGALGRPNDAWGTLALEIGAFRRMLGLYIKEASGERAGGVAAAMVTGDRSLISAEDEETLRAAGLSHLLAVSGLNMAIAGGLVFFLVTRFLALIEPLALRVAVKRPAAVIALASVTAYFILSGMSVPAQRAYVMCIIVFGAIIFDRAAINLRSFALSMIVIVLLQPESVMSPGFQMSFAATGALVAVYEAWSNRRRARERVLGPIAFSFLSLPVTSIAAGFATMPFSVFHFDRQASLGLIANFAAMPIISYLSAPAAAITLLLAPFGLADYGLDAFGRSLEGVLWVAEWTANAGPPVSAGKPMPGAALALIASGMALMVLLRGSIRVRMIVFGMCLVVPFYVWRSAPVMVAHVSTSGELFVTAKTGVVHRIEFADGEGLAPLRFADLEAEDVACDEVVCRVQTASGAIQIVHHARDASCDLREGALLVLVTGARDNPQLATRDEPMACGPNGPKILLWPQLQSTGAMTIYAPPRSVRSFSLQPLPMIVGPSELILRQPAACGDRPWRACKDD